MEFEVSLQISSGPNWLIHFLSSSSLPEQCFPNALVLVCVNAENTSCGGNQTDHEQEKELSIYFSHGLPIHWLPGMSWKNLQDIEE
ncbi:MAG: hypothetical protein ACKO23_02340 [Gemmataceae bacterium]